MARYLINSRGRYFFAKTGFIKRQSGMSVWAFSFNLISIMLVIYTAVKVIPAFMVVGTVETIMVDLPGQAHLLPGQKHEDIVSYLNGRAKMNALYETDFAEGLKTTVDKKAKLITVDLHFAERVPLIKGLDIMVWKDFQAVLPLKKAKP
jgi:hypothetical protein